MKTRLLLAAAAFLCVQGSATAGTLSDAFYKLYYLSPSGPVRVASTDALPAGSNTPPNNQWRYDYEVLNKSSNALNTFYAFFNSDNIGLAGWVSGTAPASWTITKQGPSVGNFNFKIRYLTTTSGAKIPNGQKLLCSGTFTWTGSAVPGVQNYDAVNDGGSESGVTVELVEPTPARTTSWGRMKSLYRP